MYYSLTGLRPYVQGKYLISALFAFTLVEGIDDNRLMVIDGQVNIVTLSPGQFRLTEEALEQVLSVRESRKLFVQCVVY